MCWQRGELGADEIVSAVAPPGWRIRSPPFCGFSGGNGKLKAWLRWNQQAGFPPPHLFLCNPRNAFNVDRFNADIYFFIRLSDSLACLPLLITMFAFTYMQIKEIIFLCAIKAIKGSFKKKRERRRRRNLIHKCLFSTIGSVTHPRVRFLQSMTQSVRFPG